MGDDEFALACATGLLSGPPFALARSRLAELPRQQHRLARALLEEPETFAFGSIRALGRRFDVNTTTILRFAQALGYSGYQALQARVRQTYLENAGLPQVPKCTAGADTIQRVEAVQARHLANLAQAHRRLHPADLERAAALLAGARQVLATGDSASASLALLFASLLRNAGVRASFLPAEGVERALGLDGVDRDHAVVGVGLWLPFRSVAETLALARGRGAATLAIAGSPAGPLARQADVTLTAPTLGAGLSFSVVATVAVMELVVAEIAGRRPERVEDVGLHEPPVDLLPADALSGGPTRER